MDRILRSEAFHKGVRKKNFKATETFKRGAGGIGKVIIGAAMCLLLLMICMGINAGAGYFDALEMKKTEAHMIAQSARAAGADENCAVILRAKEIWHTAQRQIDYELDMLSRVVYFEAGSSYLSQRHRELVACVVLNRCKDSRFPDTIEENVYRKGQYACAKSLYTVTREQIPEYCFDAARRAAYGEVLCPGEVIYQSQAKQGKSVYERCGNTWFCYG